MKKISLILVCCYFFLSTFSQENNVSTIPDAYPTHWWTGMKNKQLQVMLHGKDIALQKITLHPYPGIKLLKATKTENPNYIFLDLIITESAKPGQLKFVLSNAKALSSLTYELKSRRKGNGTLFAQGVRSQDLIYLIMPDRFANGDYNNDISKTAREQKLDRDSIWLRHGGDLQGVIDHLDYLQDLGVTSLWLTPVWENNMKRRTEHGYAITDHYKVDPRLGTNDTYKKLSDELHKRGMKLVQDAVYNHMGLYHFLQTDPPAKDWVHQWPKFTRPNYKEQTLFDPYVAEGDRTLQTDGWFDHVMPDINQQNPLFAKYLIQNAIWCVEEFGVDGWRIDTYIYCDLDFMNKCNQALLDEYTNITMFGECWVTGTANSAFFVRNNLNTKFKSNLIGATDFQLLFDGIFPALKESNPSKLYQTKSNDFLYKNPMNNVIFLDNHDANRIYSEMGEDMDKQKMGLAWLMTERGVPQLYYGTEIAMAGTKDHDHGDGLLRGDFFGGWKEDKNNKFTAEGRTPKENDIFLYTRKLANFRKTSSAIKYGRMTQYVPDNDVYTYFRYDDRQTVMVVMNTGAIERPIKPSRFAERISGFTRANDVVNGDTLNLKAEWKLPPKTAWVMELK